MAAALAFAAPASAGDDRAFFDRIEGSWSGPGEIVAGKYKGTRFTCKLTGAPLERKTGLELDGKCNVGLFSQAVSATIEQNGRSYRGRFLDGAAGKGLDVISGNVTADRVTVGMERAELSGAMVAKVKGDGKLAVTISVRVGDDLVPVIGMDLKRGLDRTAVGSIR